MSDVANLVEYIRSSACSPPASTVSAGTLGRKSRFSYQHLAQLQSYSSTCPLRVVALIDMDAFYAQCEMVRLGVGAEQPLAVCQWQNLIAVNYAARQNGITRFVTSAEARKLCPDIVLQHTPTWKEGEEDWAYREHAAEHIATQKVSLDPYRRQSRAIFAHIRQQLAPAPRQRVEKASIDEVFIDLSAQIHAGLLERHAALLAGPPPYDDPSERLPRPPPATTAALDWQDDTVIEIEPADADPDADPDADEDPDWDDVALQMGADIIRRVRAAVRASLGYTTSAGIAGNKMLAKLAAGHRKPAQQTVVRRRAVPRFLAGMRVTQIRNLGGKLGAAVVAAFGTEQVAELRALARPQLMRALGDDSGSWLYATLRGVDSSEVQARTQIQSMLSAKSFRPSVNSAAQAARWLRIFVADLFARLVEEGVLEHKRRPKTISLHHRHAGLTKSRQTAIPAGQAISAPVLWDLARRLLDLIVEEGQAWPCAHLSLSLGGFEDAPRDTRGIGAFLQRGPPPKAAITVSEPASGPERTDARGTKRKLDGRTIHHFFPRRDSAPHRAASGDDDVDGDVDADGNIDADVDDVVGDAPPIPAPTEPATPDGLALHPADDADHDDASPAPGLLTYRCATCHTTPLRQEKDEHDDWHFAQQLQREEEEDVRHAATAAAAINPAAASAASSARPPPKLEKGQRRLAFGR
ncbi:MAG: DNA-directed DNA polymerase eta rad30 [Phylliscum demangeonii]|nr:MAG: DNA-directed DNA polymerase eta rad30 [Phylliscum demangeonii]